MPAQLYKADVLVVGGGLAGIAAATELLDAGHRVVIVDRDQASEFGGLARWSFGGVFLVDSREQRRSGINDSPDLAYDDWIRTGELSGEDHLATRWARAYVDECAGSVDAWLRDRKVRFLPVVHWVERGLYEPGNSVPRFHMVWGTGRRLVDLLVSGLFAHDRRERLQILFRHRVDAIDITDGRVSGARGAIEPDGTDFAVEAASVIIASGGYCGSDTWLRRHWDDELGEVPDVILNGSHRFATGSLHRVAELAGGEVVNAGRSWLYAAGIRHPAPRYPNHGLSIVPPKSALWLNKFGQRIGPEPLVSGFDTRHLVSGVCHSPGGYSWQLMNWRIACKELAVSGAEYNDAISERKVFRFLRTVLSGNRHLVERLVGESDDFVVARNLAEMASRMNELTGSIDVDPDVLRTTVEDYDRCVERGRRFMNDDQLRRIAQLRLYRGDRVRTCASQRIVDRSAMPLLAIREFILSRKSLGGIRTDLGSRVLVDRARVGSSRTSVVPGLYAVGEAAGFGGGGIHGKRSLEGTFLGTCIYTGRVAAASIARGG